MDTQEYQKICDEEHLKLLSIFYYIFGGATGLFACFPIIHVVIGLVIVFSSSAFPTSKEAGPPALVGWIFVIIGGIIILIGWLIAALKLYTGYCISKRRKRIFCLVIAGLSCLSFPYGTTLGVFTFMVLLRPSVNELFIPNPLPTKPPAKKPPALSK